MVRLLFVDDDAITRRSIIENISWDSLDIELSYVAKDAYEAIQYVLENPVDLVLSDIRMPLLDGIEMAKQMKAINNTILFVFLSGFPEFTYAKEALKLNAFDFLTKPISNTKLVEVMQAAVEHIKKESTNQIVLSEGIPMMNRNRLMALISGNAQNIEGTPLFPLESYATLLIINLKFSVDKIPTILDLNKVCSRLEDVPYCLVAAVRLSTQIVLLLSDPSSLQETVFLEKAEMVKPQIMEIIESDLNVEFSLIEGNIIKSETEICESFSRTSRGMNDSGYVLSEKVKSYLLENLKDPQLTLNNVAQHFFINPCYLTVVFKKYNECNLYNYLITLRMEHAAELLRSSDMRSYEIASHVGYSDSQYFCNRFRKYYDMTTTEYRRKFRP